MNYFDDLTSIFIVHANTFVNVSYILILISIISPYYFSTNSRNKLFKVQNLFNKITLILLKTKFILFIYVYCISLSINFQLCIETCVQIFFSEILNLIPILICGKNITTRKMLYLLCYVSVLTDLMFNQQFITAQIIALNYIYDIIRDLFYIIKMSYKFRLITNTLINNLYGLKLLTIMLFIILKIFESNVNYLITPIIIINASYYDYVYRSINY
ncbi:hypothetical protein QLL95_gp0806 [Cotonvirus japonicus]|uniref:Uncharacterized protein n=1 Tax=Cotonvirus japonicus TaxID=2811091 RepID=A0ABM7NTB2_9VIRU|nr:hypothetical protein QLL95_gp0806 [Cotonvirus japonicus]BCS83317.1 hypothetical protein [Cotonvirus japonicus]